MSAFEFDPGTVIRRGTYWTLAVNRNQASIGRVVLVLNRVSEDIRDLTAAEWEALHSEVRGVTKAVDQLFAPDHYNYAFLMNVDRQVHLHVTPRYADPRRWQDVEFTDPDYGVGPNTATRFLDAEHLTHLADSIRGLLP